MAGVRRARELLDAIDACHSCRDLAAWPGIVLAELRRLVPCETAAFNDIDPVAGRLVVVLDPPAVVPPDWEEAWARHGLENPAYRRVVEDGEVGPFRLSDFLSQRELKATGLYRAMYEPMGIRYQVATALEAPAPQITAVALMRTTRDFTNDELELVRLIRPHLVRSYDTARAIAGIERSRAAVDGAADRAGVSAIMLDRDGIVIHMTPAAEAIVERHLGETATDGRLPGSLGLWVDQALTIGTPRIEMLSTAAGTIRVSIIGGRFETALLVEERADDVVSQLSERQRQVLEAISGGTTNAEAAALLHVTPSTIARHLEAIYAKLGVRNRGEALACYDGSGRTQGR